MSSHNSPPGEAGPKSQAPSAREASQQPVTSIESARQLYLAERERRQHVRSQLSIPVSIISFSIFGLVAFAQYFDISEWRELVTVVMTILIAACLICLLAALFFLARVELTFLSIEMDDLEDLHSARNEREYLHGAYLEARKYNARAARNRAYAFLLMVLSLACFVLSVALLPAHLADTRVHGRGGTPATEARR